MALTILNFRGTNGAFGKQLLFPRKLVIDGILKRVRFGHETLHCRVCFPAYC